MKRSLAIAALVSAAAFGGVYAQVPAPSAWRGISRCIDPQHPCADEEVIYRLRASTTDASRWIMDGYKLVGTDTVDMGPLELRREGPPGALIGRCQLVHGPSVSAATHSSVRSGSPMGA